MRTQFVAEDGLVRRRTTREGPQPIYHSQPKSPYTGHEMPLVDKGDTLPGTRIMPYSGSSARRPMAPASSVFPPPAGGLGYAPSVLDGPQRPFVPPEASLHDRTEEGDKPTDIPVEDDFRNEAFIPVTVGTLAKGMEEQLPAQHAADWKRFCMFVRVKISTFYDTIYDAQKEAMAENMSEHVTDERTPFIQSRKYRSQLQLLSSLSHLFEKAQYRPLSQAQYDVAMEVDFEFNHSTEVPWNELFSTAVQDFVEDGGVYHGDAPSFAKQGVLFFVRGIKESEKTDLFMDVKLDMLVDLILSFGKGNRYKQPHKVAHRVTLAEHIAKLGWATALRTKLTIKEPTFSSVVVLYKRTIEQLDEDQIKHTTTDLVLQRYADVPMADLEALLPIKRIYFRPFDGMLFGIKVVLCIVAMLTSVAQIFFPDQEGGTVALLLGLLVLSAQRVSELYFAFNIRQTAYQNEIGQWLAKKRVQEGTSVAGSIRDEVVDQEIKEALLAYFLLLRTGPMTLRHLDAAVEHYMLQRFGVRFDFDVKDAVNKLLRLSLVAPSAGERFCVAQTPRAFVTSNSALRELADATF
eukprot:TRINITY_DN4463_c0_g1_i1.p1 TRINITY_DN4463_c0_g1~~TRINITY_DN4463_c0_g1_i1.p1  ORF type:complete len:583 (+),score=103.15 TRINITY_DN4463_c0_g1_i1:25-1749(+)